MRHAGGDFNWLFRSCNTPPRHKGTERCNISFQPPAARDTPEQSNADRPFPMFAYTKGRKKGAFGSADPSSKTLNSFPCHAPHWASHIILVVQERATAVATTLSRVTEGLPERGPFALAADLTMTKRGWEETFCMAWVQEKVRSFGLRRRGWWWQRENVTGLEGVLVRNWNATFHNSVWRTALFPDC
ncbi:UNVERIFIED_CONTAM: hypothetical protein K2H54_017661 [Gekko kuhli]